MSMHACVLNRCKTVDPQKIHSAQYTAHSACLDSPPVSPQQQGGAVVLRPAVPRLILRTEISLPTDMKGCFWEQMNHIYCKGNPAYVQRALASLLPESAVQISPQYKRNAFYLKE